MKKIIIVSSIVLLGVAAYLLLSSDPTASASFTSYQAAGYEVELPASLQVHEDGSQLFAFPTIAKNGIDVDIDETYRSNRYGLTILSATPQTKEKLDDSFARFYAGFEPLRFAGASSDIVEIKTSSIEKSSADEPAAGYSGKIYAIKTGKRMYALSVFSKEETRMPQEEETVSRILRSLKDN